MMIGFIQSILSLPAKLDHGSPLLCKKYFLGNLGLSPYTIHNFVKTFREFREMLVHVGQGRTPQLNVCDL